VGEGGEGTDRIDEGAILANSAVGSVPFGIRANPDAAETVFETPGVKGQTESTRVQFLRTAQSAPSLLAFEPIRTRRRPFSKLQGRRLSRKRPRRPSTSFSPKGWPAFRRTAVEGLSGARPPADAFTGDKTRISPKGTEPSDTFDHFSRPSILSVPFVPFVLSSLSSPFVLSSLSSFRPINSNVVSEVCSCTIRGSC
jgi:hypothetical protein